MEVGVHARLEHGHPAQFVELRRLSVVIEGAGNEHIEISVAGLAGSGHQVRTGNGAELGADENASSELASGL